MATLQVKVKGEIGQLSASSFAAILRRSLDVLQDLDRRMSETSRGTVDWVISRIGEGSINLDITSRPRRGIEDDYGTRAVEGFTNGIRTISTIGETPAYFSQKNLLAIRDIVREVGRDGVSGVDYGLPDELPVVLTQETESELENLVGIRYRALGSIEGMIELVSIRRGSRRFNLTQERTLRVIRCNLPDLVEDAAIQAMRDKRRVIAFGLVAYNGRNEAISLDLRQELRFFGLPDELPTSQDLAGSDPE